MSESGTRAYRMSKRAQDIEETRRKIVEATVELHGSVGPSNTTFSAVADRAGVQRSTVYRHFPDEEALFGACTSHWMARHPFPNSSTWEGESQPANRLGEALGQLYPYYEANEQMLFNSWRDVDSMPEFVGAMMREQVWGLRDSILEAWDDPTQADSAAVALAIDFRSWQSLRDAGLSPAEAASLMTQMVTCCE